MLSRLWEHHGWITMFLGKFAYGFTAPLVVSAALSKVSYKKMLSYIIPPTIVKYSLFVLVGFYLARSYGTAAKYIYMSTIYVPAIILSFFFGYKLILRYLKSKAKGGEK
jgi:membrane protein DedA with SNARE-associated domain